MSSVLVGMFDTQSAAASAQTHLLAAGFPASAVSMTSGSTMGDAATASSTSSTHHEGAIARFFENIFGDGDDHDDADRQGHVTAYHEAFNRGAYGVTVATNGDDEMDKAEEILNACGAVDIDERSATWRQEGWTGDTTAAAGATAGMTGAGSTTGEVSKLQEVREELKVGKRAVSRGGVRVFSRMTETPVEESVMLREEHADIKRTAVDRPATAADLAAFQEGSIEVREMAEEAIVSKTARVTGEVEVGKVATEREETIRDTVRETKVEVEQLAGNDTLDKPKAY